MAGVLCRAKPPVGRNEMKGLFAGADAPNPAQLAAMGSRNALSPRRATALMRETLGHTTVNCYPPCVPLGQGMLHARTCNGITVNRGSLISWSWEHLCRHYLAVSCHKA